MPGTALDMGWKMLQMHQDAKAEVPWEDIIQKAAQTNPVCQGWLQELAIYVRKSPPSGELLEDLNESSKVFAPPEDGQRVIGQEFFQKLIALSWGKADKFYWVENAILKANMAGDKTVDNICKTIPPSALNLAKSDVQRSIVKEADKLMESTREVIKLLGVNVDTCFHHVCMLDVRLAMLICKRPASEEFGSYTNVNDIAKASMFALTTAKSYTYVTHHRPRSMMLLACPTHRCSDALDVQRKKLRCM